MRAFFLITIFFIFTNFQSSICYDDPQFIECSRSFSCKTLTNLSYPFWGDGRPNYCGHPGFELRCPEFASYPLIKINNLDFRVLKINQSNYRNAMMTIARFDVFGDLCILKIRNTTLNLDLVNYAATASNLTLLYDCEYDQQLFFVPNHFSCRTDTVFCGDDSFNNFSCRGDKVFYGDDSFMARWRNNANCTNIVIPVFRTALEDLLKPQQYDLSKVTVLGEALQEGFEVEFNGIGRLCGDCEESGGRCGFDNKTTQFICFCRDQQQLRVCPSHGKWDWELKVGIAVGAGVLAILLTCIMIYYFKRRTQGDRNFEAFIRDYAYMNAKRYRFSDVKKMTNSFKDRLGQGGYGEVYRGTLLDGSLVAVKVLDSSKGNGQDFINEVASIGRTSHVNVVTLLGFCLEGNKRALIYEYMPNGSLEKFIYNESPLLVTPRLEWEKLLQIATGIARGLEYLHRGCSTRILHFDIKPHNILLDEDLCPKISDFGLAKLCQKKESIVSMLDARGTIGYIAPEVWSRNFGGVSSKSDVYSYGMMTLEMAGGRKNVKVGESESSEIYFPDWIYKYLELNNSNVEWEGIRTSEESEIARKMLVVGLWCIQTRPADRPSMSKVIEMLEGSLEALQIPPKPYMFSPTSPEVLTESLAESSTISAL